MDVTFPEAHGGIDLLGGRRPPARNNWLRFGVGSNRGHIFDKKS